jgi:rhodanese-related sulfurtransferase
MGCGAQTIQPCLPADALPSLPCSIMHRHPEAARALRQAVVRPLVQEGIRMYARAARWVDAQHAAGMPVTQCVPHRAQLGGDFVGERRLHK